MTSGMRFCLCLFVSFALVTAAKQQGATPISKVIKLLKDLSTKVAAEGKEEAAQYDKFACFCKEQADEKLYSIEKSDAKIDDLKAEIKKLDSAIAELNTDVSDLSKHISALESEIDTKTKKRAGEYADYKAKATDMNEAIDACTAAIEALRGSKTAMKGAKVDFAQMTSGLIKAVAAQPALAAAADKVSLLSKVGGAPKFQYQSNDIIATLEDLNDTFKSMKKDLDMEEHDINSAFEKDKLALSNDKRFSENDRAEKEAIVEAKNEDLEADKSARDDETDDKDADQAFLDEVTAQCEAQAALFDQRSSTRSGELSALNEATAELVSGASEKMSSQKALVGLQRAANVPVKAASFVQIKSIQHHKQADKNALIQRVQSLLVSAADRTNSAVLSSLTAKISAAEDHFVKVRGLIKDLILKLKDDARSEATQKGICDEGMRNAINGRDDANSKIEIANAKITKNTGNKNDLTDEINKLNGNIAELKKALLEATELRADDEKDNTHVMKMSKEGAQSVRLALSVLSTFYNNALVQVGKYTPPKSDRDGNTVGDLAPKALTSTYHGSSESKGITGILEVILSDFERTEAQAGKDDGASLAAFEKFERDTNADVKGKDDRIKAANGQLSDAKANILEQQGALADAQELLATNLEALDDLEAMCVKGEETWEERKQKRQDEVEALKEALAIFDNWQN